MPNGGSDCCGTCWFNSKNEGKAGYHTISKEGEVICEIRGLKIEAPFSIYCANHPHHSSEKMKIPIGVVYICKEGFPYKREVWKNSPDTEEIRLNLLKLLNKMPEQPTNEYPYSIKLDHEVIIQLGLFIENRAIVGLKRVLEFDINQSSNEDNGYAWDRRFTISYALESLARISIDEAIPFIRKFIFCGLDRNLTDGEDEYGVLRYYAVKSLQYWPTDETMELLNLATSDPNFDVSSLAKQMLST